MRTLFSVYLIRCVRITLEPCPVRTNNGRRIVTYNW